MKICYLASCFSIQNSGGIGTYIDTVACELSKRGHSVTVICPAGKGRASNHYDILEVQADSIHGDRRLRDASAMYKALKYLDFDIIEATDWGLEAFACDSIMQKVIIRFHTPESIVCKLNGEARMKDSASVISMEGDYFKKTSNLTSPCIAMAKLVSEKFLLNQSSIQIIPNPVRIEDLKKNSLNWVGKNSQVIVFFGRLERRKGIYEFATTAAKLLKKNSKAEIMFIGADTRIGKSSVGRDLRNILQPWLDRIHFVGHISGMQKYKTLMKCRCIVFPSIWENFSYACLEAMACGLPIIASKYTGFDEMICHGQDGILINPSDSNIFLTTLERALKGNFDKMGENARESVHRFDVKTVITEYEEYYDRIVKKNRCKYGN